MTTDFCPTDQEYAAFVALMDRIDAAINDLAVQIALDRHRLRVLEIAASLEAQEGAA